ncbi:Cloroperoxidase [Gigaspora margarita]|uniref:Cloroperoxidase n=2 Tax=Gigaspora margarita TaxID=4874 RepID=A0A8H4A1M4_GIGMA|nr:Cloroperoxidase [Gigaspora margarita]
MNSFRLLHNIKRYSMSAYVWQGPGTHDKRSPCPALNALANYGYLPRSGENITKSQLARGLQEGLNASFLLANFLAYGGFNLLGKLLDKTINLDDLNQHNKCEHDASLTRKDFYFGDNHTVNPELVDLLLKQNIDGKIKEESLSKLHWIRLNNSKEVNPTLLYNFQQKFLSAGESSLLLNFIGANTNLEIEIEKLEVFLKHERFPEGWRKPNKVVGIWPIINSLRLFLKRYDQLEKEQKK